MQAIRQNHNNFITRQFLHVSGLTGPSSGNAQLLVCSAGRSISYNISHLYFMTSVLDFSYFNTVSNHFYTRNNRKEQVFYNF